MATCTWTRETPVDTDGAVLTWTGTQSYNFFGALIRDNGHTSYSETAPYAGWFTDTFNAALQIICSHAPSWREVLTTTTTAGNAVYLLPDYVVSFRDVLWVMYNGTIIKRVTQRAVREGLPTGVSSTSFDTQGSPTKWEEDGDRGIRLLPVCNAAATLKVLAYCLPPALTNVASGTTQIPLAAHLKMAPAFYCAAIASLIDGNLDKQKAYEGMFWRLVSKKIEDNVESAQEQEFPDPTYKYQIPNFEASADDL